MPPDLNSLPPSPHSPSASDGTSRNHSPAAPRAVAATSPLSLAATAAMNAGIHNEDARRPPSSGSMRRDVERARRRSSIRVHLNLNDPAMPAPGEMQQSPPALSRSQGTWPPSPQHERAPSLGELHQELEYEQEGQVNRLLHMIRHQQDHLSALHTTQPPHSSSAVDDSTPNSEPSTSIRPSHPHSYATHVSQSMVSPLPSATQPRSRSPFAFGSISRQSSFADRSRHGSHAGSPALRPISGQAGTLYDYHDMLPASATIPRDESAFYQAETQNLTRENQMLKLRIRELERQLSESNPAAQVTHSPDIPASLAPATPPPSDQAQPPAPASTE